MAYCDFCPCNLCKHGDLLSQHAQTKDGRWICDVCYGYSLCIAAFRAQGLRRGPCGDHTNDPPCTHRPGLTTDWTKREVN